MKRLVFLLAALLLPGVAAQSGDVLGAELTLEVPLDHDDLGTEHNPARDNDSILQPCGSGHIGPLGSGRGFRFEEDADQAGCSLVGVDVRIPSGTRSLEVVFGGAKTVRQPTGDGVGLALDIRVVTDVRIQSATGDDLSSRSYFDPETERERLDPPFVWQVPAGTLPPSVTVAWFFSDEGPNLRDGLAGPVFGQGVVVDVSEPTIRFVGIQAQGGTTSERGSTTRDSAETIHRVTARVPFDSEGASLAFRVRNTLSIDHVLLPDGRRLAETDFSASEDRGILTLQVPPEAIDAYGPGVYTAVFTSSQALQPSSTLAPLIVIVMVAPLTVGVYATRSAAVLQQRARGGFANTARDLRTALASLWVIYVLALSFVVIGRMWPLIVSWPLQVEAAVMHAIFVLLTVAFVALGFTWRRRLANTMETELAQKERTNRELLRSNEELQQFAYVASHDLQEPLRTVARFTQLLERRYGAQLDDEAREFMAYTVDGAHRMQELIDALLQLSRVETSGARLRATNLDEVLERVLSALSASIEDCGATVTRDAMPVVLGDPVQLGQLLQNLLSNALKFRATDRPPCIHVGVERRGDRWEVRVEDNGIGIEARHHERIFTVFQRLHGRDAYEGTGIGLAVCKKIVERHGGRIGLTSRPGEGSVFFFTVLDAQTPSD